MSTTSRQYKNLLPDPNRLKVSANIRDPMGTFMQKLFGSDTKLTPAEQTKMLKCLAYNIAAFGFLIFSIIMAYYAFNDKRALASKFLYYLFFIITPMAIGAFLMIPSTSNPYSFIMSIMMGIGALAIGIYFYSSMSSSSQFSSIVSYMLFFILMICTLAIVYRIFIKYLKNLSGWVGLLFKIVFFLPCLLSDLADALAQDVNNTPRSVLILFAIEVGVIGLFFLSKYVISKFRGIKSKSLISTPIFLSKQTIVGSNELLRHEKYKRNSELIDLVEPAMKHNDYAYNKNYSVDMWVYINHQGDASTKQITPIFQIGRAFENGGKPLIVYDANATSPNTFKVFYTNAVTQGQPVSNNNGIPFAMPAQKWNYVVMTYNNNVFDLFVNGELVVTKALQTDNNVNEVPLFTIHDEFLVGYGDKVNGEKGVHGAICNLNYHSTPLALNDIVLTYNMLKHKNPPVNYVM